MSYVIAHCLKLVAQDQYDPQQHYFFHFLQKNGLDGATVPFLLLVTRKQFFLNSAQIHLNELHRDYTSFNHIKRGVMGVDKKNVISV